MPLSRQRQLWQIVNVPEEGSTDEATSCSAISPDRDLSSDIPEADAASFLTVSISRFEHQMSSIDTLDNKAGALFAGGVGETAFLIAILALRPGDRSLSSWSWGLISLTTLVALWTLVWAWRGQSIRTWEGYPSHENLWALAVRGGHVSLQAGLTMAEAYKSNEAGLERKVGMVRKAEYGIAVLTLVVAVTSLAALGT